MPEVNPFKTPAPEMLRFFEAKGVRPSGDWTDFTAADHAVAFTAAQTAGYDVVKDLRDAMAKAIRERQEFKDFRAGLEPLLREKGWWGKKVEVDPVTGEERTIQLGSVRRLQTIYWANTRTSWAAGEWEQIQRTKRVLPYLVYEMSTAENKREEHLAWVGVILPVDDPWWQEHYPPNGWGCMCRVRQISEFEAIALGYNPENPQRPQSFGTMTFTNRRTGEVMEVPAGIDPGWNNNAGMIRTQNAANLLAGRIDAMNEDARRAAIADLSESWMMKRIQSGQIAYDPTSPDPLNAQRGAIAVPFATLPAELGAAIGADTTSIRLSVAAATKQLDPAKGRNFVAADYAKVQELILSGEAIKQGDRDIAVQGMIDGKPWLAVVRRAAANPSEVFLVTLQPIDERDFEFNRRRGDVIPRQR